MIKLLNVFLLYGRVCVRLLGMLRDIRQKIALAAVGTDKFPTKLTVCLQLLCGRLGIEIARNGNAVASFFAVLPAEILPFAPRKSTGIHPSSAISDSHVSMAAKFKGRCRCQLSFIFHSFAPIFSPKKLSFFASIAKAKADVNKTRTL